jgi:hypothetical protein
MFITYKYSTFILFYPRGVVHRIVSLVWKKDLTKLY